MPPHSDYAAVLVDEDDDSKIFPQRLMEILCDDRNEEAICWLPHGRAFIIRDRSIFAEAIMPRFFPRKAKYSSFTRKLNRWNFIRVSSGPELGAYYHEFFLRDKPHLAAQMFCKNARAKLAMANDPLSKPAINLPVVQQEPANKVVTAAVVNNEVNLNINTSNKNTEISNFMKSVGSNNRNLNAINYNSSNSNTNNGLMGPPMCHPQQKPQQQQPLSSMQMTPAMIATLQLSKQQDAAKAALLGTFPSTNVQLLERHVQMLEREQRLAIQHQQQRLAMQQFAVGNPNGTGNNDLLQLQQLMQLRMRQQQRRVPSNFRASAA